MLINRVTTLVMSVTLAATIAGCSTDSFSRVKTTEGYLSETKVKLAERVSEDIGRIVFIRENAQNKNIPTIYLNDRVIGSLPPHRYSETLVCPGEQIIRIDTRTDAVKAGANTQFTAEPGQTHYLQVYELNEKDFGARTLDEEQVKQLAKGLYQSHIINRHQPICNAPLKVIEQINLSADALFKFDKTEMLPSGQASVRKLVQDIATHGAQVEQIRVIGHTDRLGSDNYNDRLSLARANTVANYMKQQGLKVPVVVFGKGEREPITRNCRGDKATAQLIKCLQPDRRVNIELMGLVEKIEHKGISSQ